MKKRILLITIISIFPLRAMDHQLENAHEPHNHKQELKNLITHVTASIPTIPLKASSVYWSLKNADTIPGESCLNSEECCGCIANEISTNSMLSPEEVALYCFDEAPGSKEWIQKRLKRGESNINELRSLFEIELYDGHFDNARKIADGVYHSSLLPIVLEAKDRIEICDPDDDDQLDKIIENLQKTTLNVPRSTTIEK